MALQKEPNDPYLFKQLAGIAYERGNKEEA